MPDTKTRVTLKPRRARPFFARHPWVFVTSIGKVEGPAEPGGVADVFSHEGKFVARGLFNPNSAIRVRLHRWDDGPLDPAYWSNKIESAIRLRRDVLRLDGPGTACRMVASEGDGLSGLTVDRYDRWLLIQFSSLALLARKEELVAECLRLTGAEGALVRADKGVAGQEGLSGIAPEVFGKLPDSPVEIVENDIKYLVDIRAGQKTGFFLDQRTNRAVVAGYCRGKRVLDLYTYSGGFALNAVKNGGAVEALGIDSSFGAIGSATRHAQLNGVEAATFEHRDVHEKVEELRTAGDRFDVVVCDPPKFARGPKSVEEAVKGYLNLNRAVLALVEPGGLLVTCSCSGLVDRGLFADVLSQVAELSGRPIQFLEQRGQSPDHPVSASCLETEYLKCFICRVG